MDQFTSSFTEGEGIQIQTLPQTLVIGSSLFPFSFIFHTTEFQRVEVRVSESLTIHKSVQASTAEVARIVVKTIDDSIFIFFMNLLLGFNLY
jgi:hypothetical protein